LSRFLLLKKINQIFSLSTVGIYTISSLINAAIPFVLLPILTRYFSPEEYGLVTMFTLMSSIMGAFIGFSVHGAIGREFFNQEIEFKEFVFNCLLILFCSTFLLGTIFLLFVNKLSNISSLPKEWILAVLITCFFQFFVLVLLTIYQVQLKAKEYAFIQVSQSLTNICLTGLFVVYFLMGWQGRIGAIVINSIIVGCFSLMFLIQKWCVVKINFGYIKRALNFGLPLIPHTLGAIIIVVVDRFVIHQELGIFEVGIYTAGLQIAKIVGLVTDSFNKAYGPWLFDKLDKHDEEKNIIIVRFTYVYFLAIIVFSIIVGILAPYIVNFILGEKFTYSAMVIFWIALGEAFNGMYFMVVGYVFYMRKTIYLTFITFLTGIVSILLTYAFVHYNGLIGAAQAYAISLFISFILTWWCASKVYPMPWNIGFR